MASSQSCSRFMVPVIMPISTLNKPICLMHIMYPLVSVLARFLGKPLGATCEQQLVQYESLIHVNFS
jgi:hypothetical protein